MSSNLEGVNCVVIGGGGFIGRAIIRALLQEGAIVRGFGRVSRFGLPDTSLPWIYGDFQDQTALARAVEGAQIVFHLAGGSTPQRSNASLIGDIEASLVATVQLLNVCNAEGVRRVIFASSGGTVYGVSEEIPISEDAATNPISAYGINKLAVEKYLYLFGVQTKIEHVSLRIANPFGPNQDPFGRQGLVAASIFKMLADDPIEIWGNGLVRRDYIYVDDVADAFISAANYRGPLTSFNIGSGEGKSVDAVVDSVADVLGIRAPKKVYRPGQKADVPSNVLDISRARSELGWRPNTSWRNAILQTAEWMRREPTLRALLDGKKHA